MYKKALGAIVLIGIMLAVSPHVRASCRSSPTQKMIGSAETIRPGNGPEFLPGSRTTAVILFHGFMASPFEVRSLGTTLNKQGFPVLMPLIAGFGRSDSEANYASVSDWRNSVDQAVQEVSRCYDKVILMGFSLGGALVTDFALRNTDSSGRNIYGSKIVAMTLISPYFQAAVSMAKAINDLVLYYDSDSLLSLANLYKISPLDDLKAPIVFKEYYNQAMPLLGVNNVLKLGNQIQNQAQRKSVMNIPTLLVVSEADGTIDIEAAREFVSNHISNTRFLTLPKDRKVPHQILVREFSNGQTDFVVDQVSDFALRY